MENHTASHLRVALGAVAGASPRKQSDRRFHGPAWVLGLLLPMSSPGLAEDFSQTLATREQLRQQERERARQALRTAARVLGFNLDGSF